MLTVLPDLPFEYANAELYHFHSPTKASRRMYPRTDLATLTSWTSFPNDIHQAIQSAAARANLLNTPFTLDVAMWTRAIANELEIRMHATPSLHHPVEKVAKMLGVNGRFSSCGGCTPILGAPHYSWVPWAMGTPPRRPKLVVEYKTWWSAHLEDLPAIFESTNHDTLSRQSFKALQQIYGYMTFNNLKFGILSNWKRAWFLRRAGSPDRKSLECFLVELGGSSPAISMLKAWVGMVLLAEDCWLYTSPTLSRIPSARDFGSMSGGRCGHSLHGKYQSLPLDFRLCHFDLNTTRLGAIGCVVKARLPHSTAVRGYLHVSCKVMDILRYHEADELLTDEIHAYMALRHLQGQVIPTFYGFYEVWGILRFLALEFVGNAIPEDEEIDQTLRMNMKAALQRIHDVGFIHGDIARRNFCRTKDGAVFLVDLESCRPPEKKSELATEMKEVDML